MQRKLLPYLAAAALTFAVGCATMGSLYTQYDDPAYNDELKIDALLGSPKTDVLQQYGKPSQINSDSQGGEMWIYVLQNSVSVSSNNTNTSSSASLNNVPFFSALGLGSNSSTTNNTQTQSTNHVEVDYFIGKDSMVYSWHYQNNLYQSSAGQFRAMVMKKAYDNRSCLSGQDDGGNGGDETYNSEYAGQLGWWYVCGSHGLAKEPRKGIKLFNMAIARSLACTNQVPEYYLGVCYENGLGVAKDVDQAEVWYKKAAYDGNSDAKVAMYRLEPEGFTDVPPTPTPGPARIR